MIQDRSQQGPEQLSLFQRKRKSVTWLMRRWGKSRPTILHMLEAGVIAGFRLHPTANWEIDEEDVLAYEAGLQEEVQSVLDGRKRSPINGKKGLK